MKKNEFISKILSEISEKSKMPIREAQVLDYGTAGKMLVVLVGYLQRGGGKGSVLPSTSDLEGIRKLWILAVKKLPKGDPIKSIKIFLYPPIIKFSKVVFSKGVVYHGILGNWKAGIFPTQTDLDAISDAIASFLESKPNGKKLYATVFTPPSIEKLENLPRTFEGNSIEGKFGKQKASSETAVFKVKESFSKSVDVHSKRKMERWLARHLRGIVPASAVIVA